MALTLTKEEGSGAADANSYGAAADGDSYHDGHLYASAWTGATTAQKEAALVMATRLIDRCYQFGGFRASNTQALQWPRRLCPDPDGPRRTGLYLYGSPAEAGYFPSDAIPACLVDAVCETARELLKADSSDAPDSQELKSIQLVGGMRIDFDKADQQPQIPPTAQMFLSKLGIYLGGRSSVAKLVRV
jgi:hypothetical protein